MDRKKRAVVAITGASGIIFGVRLLKHLLRLDCDIDCIVSDAAAKILPEEIDNARDITEALKNICDADEIKKIDAIKFFDESNFYAPCASGSYYFDAMAIAPCSMKTLGKIAHSIGDNLIVRAAEVALKERRKLVVLPRETPLALTHIRNMCTISEAGGIILPPSPAFYQKPKNLDDAIDFVAARTLSAMGFESNILKEWGYEKKL